MQIPFCSATNFLHFRGGIFYFSKGKNFLLKEKNEKNTKKVLTNDFLSVIIVNRIIIYFFFGGILRFFRVREVKIHKNLRKKL